MFRPKQPLFVTDLDESDRMNQPAHVGSALCWCDPVVAVDEFGREELVHQDVTWH